MWRRACIFGVYLLLAAAYTWPLLRDIQSRIPSNPADPVFFAASLWWNATTVPFSTEWWNAPHYYPSLGVSAFSETLAGIGPTFTPVYWLTRSPIAAHNVAYFLTWPLSAFAAYLLARHLTRREDAAFLAGLAYTFTPYRTAEIAHIQSLSSYYMPLVLLGLHGFLERRHARWLVLFGAAWLLQSLANGYYMLFGAVLIGFWLAYFCSRRSTWRAGATIVAAWVVASLPLVPIMYKYSVVHDHFGLTRSLNEILAYSARPHSFAEVSGDIWFWRSVLPQGKDDLFPGVTALALVLIAALFLLLRRSSTTQHVVAGFPPMPKAPSRLTEGGHRTFWLRGLRVVLALATTMSVVAIAIALWIGPWTATVAGLVIRMKDLNRALAVLFACGIPLLLITPRTRQALARRSPLVFYAAATVVIAVLCCGPILHAGENVLLSPAPYRWLMPLPGFSKLRVLPRFWMLGVLCLSTAAGLAFSIIRPSRAARGVVAFSIAAAGLLVDGWMPTMRMAVPPVLWTAVEPRGRPEPILELPIGPDWDWDATFRAVAHRRRVVNGVSGYDPPHYFALREGLVGRDPAMLAALASLGAFDVVINTAADQDGALARYVSSAPGALRVAEDGVRVAYRIPAGPPEPSLGEVIPIGRVQGFRHDEILANNKKDADEVHDGKIGTGWGDLPQQPGQWLVVDLGSVHDVGGLTHTIGEYFLDFPRQLAIEVSTDGTVWERVWEGTGAAPAFLALVREPREGAMRFTFAPRRTRFIRLLQVAHDDHMWRVSELQVHAPTAR